MNTRIYVEVPSDLKERLREHAYHRSKTQAEVVTAALVEYLDRQGQRQDGRAADADKGGAS